MSIPFAIHRSGSVVPVGRFPACTQDVLLAWSRHREISLDSLAVYLYLHQTFVV